MLLVLKAHCDQWCMLCEHAHNETTDTAVHALIKLVLHLASILKQDSEGSTQFNSSFRNGPLPYDDMLKSRRTPLKFQTAWRNIAKNTSQLIYVMRDSCLRYQISLIFNTLILTAEKVQKIDVHNTSSRLLFIKLFDNAIFAANNIRLVSTNGDIRSICSSISKGFLENRINI